MYSQGNEEKIISEYFGEFIGTLLSIGENNGLFLSNSLALIEKGWGACVVEPAPLAFDELQMRHVSNEKVICFNLAVSDYNGRAKFYDSDSHLKIGDKSLLSTLDKKETERWGSTQIFEEINVEVVDFKTLMELVQFHSFDFITIDAEGQDLIILRQIDLAALKTKCICIEHNGDMDAIREIKTMASYLGLQREIYFNAENIILAK